MKQENVEISTFFVEKRLNFFYGCHFYVVSNEKRRNFYAAWLFPRSMVDFYENLEFLREIISMVCFYIKFLRTPRRYVQRSFLNPFLQQFLQQFFFYNLNHISRTISTPNFYGHHAFMISGAFWINFYKNFYSHSPSKKISKGFQIWERFFQKCSDLRVLFSKVFTQSCRKFL